MAVPIGQGPEAVRDWAIAHDAGSTEKWLDQEDQNSWVDRTLTSHGKRLGKLEQFQANVMGRFAISSMLGAMAGGGLVAVILKFL